MLVVKACRALCDWVETPSREAGDPVFSCHGCGSQWARSQAWTPAQADGTVPEAVRRERQRG